MHLKSDIEMGGTDQKFNLLMGRTLQRSYDIGKEQSVFMMPLLVGLDGVKKMSKSLGNYIGITDPANDMFAKTMSISDALMWDWYLLLSAKSSGEINELKIAVDNGSYHPMQAKKDLAREITARFYDDDTSQNALAEWEKIHSKGALPSHMKEYSADADIWIVDALKLCKLCASSSDARRAIKSNAVSIDQVKISDEQMRLQAGKYALQVGKKSLCKTNN